MAYVKQEWKNLPNQTTPVNATRMNHIEDGIYDNSVAISNIIESGSNSNGSWIKYSDGTMICSGKKELSSVAITNSINNGAFFASEVLTSFADFPVSFIGKPTSFSMSVSSGGGYGAWIQKMYPPSATNINNFRIIGTWNSTQNFEVSYIAIGKWK